jgi:hypothetical protein
MARTIRRYVRFWPGGLGLALLLLLGCFGNKGHWEVDNCSSIPAGAMPPPNGTYMNAYIEAQAGKAEADDFVVYRHEWYLGGHELGPYGRYHIDQIIKRLPTVPFPVLVQTQMNEQIDETRRQVIVQALAAAGVPDPDHRVIVGFPQAEGLYGEEAPTIYRQMLRGTATGAGNTGFGAAGGFGGLGGASGLGVTGLGGLGGIGGIGGIPY